MQLFHFRSRDVHPVQDLLLCTKFHEHRMIFHWDMAIYRFSKWRPSAIMDHHTRPHTKSLLLAAAACQISCQSDTQIWRYNYLNFSHNWLEMPIQATKWGFFGGLWTPKCDYSLSRPPKGTSLRKSREMEFPIPSGIPFPWTSILQLFESLIVCLQTGQLTAGHVTRLRYRLVTTITQHYVELHHSSRPNFQWLWAQKSTV